VELLPALPHLVASKRRGYKESRLTYPWKPGRLPFVAGDIRRVIGPIGALYALVLWTGNSAYLYISVSFIQMLKVNLRLH